jgi:hypothetical protein
MTRDAHRHEEQLMRLMDAFAEATILMSDTDLRSELEGDGYDTDQIAVKVAAIWQECARNRRLEKLVSARAEYRQALSRITDKGQEIVHGIAEQRGLLQEILASQSYARNAFLTFQHRDFSHLSDEDVASCLRQLHALGIIDEFKRQDTTNDDAE